MGERLHLTLTQLRVEQPVLVGHSASGILATGYAANFPVRGVVNVDQPLLVAPFAGMLQSIGEQLRGPGFGQAFAMFEQSIGLERLPEPERARAEGTRRVTQELVLDHWTLPLTTPPPALQAMIDGFLDVITAPYLFLAGEELPPPVRAHLEAHLAQLEIVTWPGTGHLPQLVDPAGFARLISEFASRSV